MSLKDDIKMLAEIDASITPNICVKRRHGLGNVVCLLPILDRLYSEGYRIKVITRTEWIHTFTLLRPEFIWSTEDDPKAFDMDELTRELTPTEHRTDEFARMLGLGRPFTSLKLDIPEVWSEPFQDYKGSIVFAPEGGHPSRQWPIEQAAQLHNYIDNMNKLILVGLNPSFNIPCDIDLRGKLGLHELFGLLNIAGTVITMDSAVLHIAAALNRPTVVIFGGVNPSFRVRGDQPVVAIQSEMECCPCNKHESCHGHFTCIHNPCPQDVAKAIPLAQKTHHRIIKILPISQPSLVSV
ncbi:MAG: glycosyltransferase family 9 protein [Sedimentisphaerales bacterium]|nr:glycosyltransferase family 9 protein [Sedimentisphaerales bacterium]